MGKTIRLDGVQYVVVGVLPPEFTLPNARLVGGVSGTDKPIEAFIPFGWTSDQLQEIEGDHNYFAIARLKPGVSQAEASAELNALQRRITDGSPT